MTAFRTICLLGGPRHGTRTLACGAVHAVASTDLLDRCTIVGHENDGTPYEYAIIGTCQNGELLAVEV